MGFDVSAFGNITTFDSKSIELSWIDYGTLFGYFGGLFFVSYLISRKSASRQQQGQSSSEFFLADRSVPWWAVSASLFASNIGSEHFVGLAGSAAKDGISVGWYELGAMPIILFLGFFLLPVYLNASIVTMPDYLERRYSVKCRQFIVIVSLILYIVTKVAATLFAGQIIIVELVVIDPTVAVVLLILCTSVYTMSGGLEAVIYTEALQTLVLVLGGIAVLVYTLSACDGIAGIQSELPDRYFHYFRPATDETYPWTGFVFGYYCVSVWYWGCDQVIVQRALAAKNIAHGEAGCVGASVLKVLPLFMMVIPGLGAKTLMTRAGLIDEHGALLEDPSNPSSFSFDQSYPWLVKNIVPINARGFIIAGMLASLMSSLASVFNSASTLFTLDIWRKWYPETSEARLVLVGRVTVVVLGISSLLWLPIIPLLGDRLFLIIQKPPAFVAPPILVCFLSGITSRIPTAKAALATLYLGVGFGLTRFACEVLEDVSGYKDQHGAIFGGFTAINFLHFAIINFWSSCIFLFSYSLWRRSKYIDEAALTDGLDSTLFFQFGLYDKLMREFEESQHAVLHSDESIELTQLEPESAEQLEPKDQFGNGFTASEDGMHELCLQDVEPTVATNEGENSTSSQDYSQVQEDRATSTFSDLDASAMKVTHKAAWMVSRRSCVYNRVIVLIAAFLSLTLFASTVLTYA